ncbi:FAD/NAD(P)-binding domain-containing protein [Colletotrichum falcatum]|nr:FAD/NAD(P)-binding domain-containing protein [Colletotrichum falcatum]
MFNIIVVGGGIAGISAAIALRGPRRRITVLEQSQLNREIGATISLQPNASKIVEKQWGLEEALSKKGSMADQGFRIYSVEGKLHADIPFHLKKSYGADRMMYHSKSVLRKSVLGNDAAAVPTGLSAYRLIIDSSELEQDKDFTSVIDPRKSLTTMIMGHDRRIIMGPARNGSIYSVVALVPDDKMREAAEGKSWTTKGDPQKMRASFEVFPAWAKAVFKNCTEVGLWQLRDMDPLETWHRGRTIIIGDAAHPMLPTQGQGASQAIEDAEALGVIFGGIEENPTSAEVESRLKAVFDCRFERVSLIQGYSRQAGKPATDKATNSITMNPAEFMDYNCMYNGAKDWMERQAKLKELAAPAGPKDADAPSVLTQKMVSLSLGSE